MPSLGRVPAASGGARAPDGRSRVIEAVAAHAARAPHHAAAGYADRDGRLKHTISYSQLWRAASSLAGDLVSRFAPGDVVTLAGANRIEMIVWSMAGLSAGLRLLMLHPRSTVAEASAAMRLAGSRAIVTTTSQLRQIGEQSLDFDNAMSRFGEAPPDTGANSGHAGMILQSSGTTGQSKLALRDSAALDADAANVAEAASLSPDDHVLIAMPQGHSYGVDMTLASLSAGATMVVMDGFDAPAVAACMGAGTVTVLPGVPVMFDAISRIAPPRAALRPRLAFSAGTPLASRVSDQVEHLWAFRVGQLYGATELGSVTLNDSSSPLFAAESVGTAMRGVSILVCDAADPAKQLAPGLEGQIAVRAPSMLSCYLPDESPPLIDGHFLTGDLGRLDDQGRLFITGRIKLLIDVGGLKVNPLEVEAVLTQHPAIAECAIVALPLSDTVTRLRAICVPRDAAHAPRPEELRRFLKERVAPHKIPRVFEIVETLPKSPTGKVLRRALVSDA